MPNARLKLFLVLFVLHLGGHALDQHAGRVVSKTPMDLGKAHFGMVTVKKGIEEKQRPSTALMEVRCLAQQICDWF